MDNELVQYFDEVNLILNKPVGYLSANKDNLHNTVMDLIEEPFNRYDLKIAGRLDLDSEGLLILTTDGNFVHDITNPNKNIPKVYEVITDKDTFDYKKLLEGVIIKDGRSNDYLAKATNIEKLAECSFKITITEGKFHQVKRMFLYLGLEVTSLKRISIGNLKLNSLKVGEYELFNQEEIYD